MSKKEKYIQMLEEAKTSGNEIMIELLEAELTDIEQFEYIQLHYRKENQNGRKVCFFDGYG